MTTQLGEQVAEEGRPFAQMRPQQLVLCAIGRSRAGAGAGARRGAAGGRSDRGGVLAEVQRDAPGAPERAGADPDDLAAGAERVEPSLGVGAGAPWQHVALPGLDGQRESLQRYENLA